MTLSIIIPVYNAEPYLEKCVKSCSGPDSEIILVNDGSTDGSLELMRKLGAGIPGIRLFSQENSGPGAARNVGIRAAKGEYVWFVDADDWLEAGAIGSVLGTLADHKCDYISISARNTDSEVLRNTLPATDDPKSVFHSLRWLDCDTMYIWRRQFLLDNGLFFKEKLFFEDSEMIPKALYLADTCHVTNKMLYNVYVRQGSITRSKSLKKNYDHVKVGKYLLEFRNDSVPDEKSRQVFNQRICVMLNRAFLGMTKCSREEIKEFNRKLSATKELPHVFMESSILRYKFEFLLFHLLGRNYVAAFRFLNVFKGLKA